MKRFDYETALNQLGLSKCEDVNPEINYDLIPSWVRGRDFLYGFLPHVEIIVDSREQENWIAKACEYYNILSTPAKKDTKAGTENLKEGDYTFRVHMKDKVYDFTGVFAMELKNKASEFHSNLTKDRERVEREFTRQLEKGYKKFILVLTFGNCLFDLIDYQYGYWSEGGKYLTKDCGILIFNTILSWQQKYKFDVLQVEGQQDTKKERWKAREKLFWLILIEMFFFFRNEIKEECFANNLIECP